MASRKDPVTGKRVNRFRTKLDRVIDGERARNLGDALTYIEMVGILESVKLDLLDEMDRDEEDDYGEET